MPTLLTPPPVLDDMSRRGPLTGLGAVTTLTACGGPAPLAPSVPAVPTGNSGVGLVQVPVDPLRVVSAKDRVVGAAGAADRNPLNAAVLEIMSTTTRRTFLAALAAAGLLGACGAPAAGPVAATRPITDPSGRTVDIPADPQRIVALDPNRLIVDLVALGFVPVGATTNPTNPGGRFAETLGPEADGMVSVGASGSADLEQIAALAPDLIFHAIDYEDIPVERLEAIAPVVRYERGPTGLLGPMRWLGGLLDRADRAAAVEADLRAAIDERRAAIGLAGRRVAVVNLANFGATPTVYVNATGTNASEFVELLGATIVPDRIDGTAVEPGTVPEVSLELLPTVLADAEFVLGLRYGGSADNDRLFDARVDDPIWQAVPAVAAGQVAYVDVQRAGGNIGVAGIRLALDDLAAQRAT